MDRKYPSHPLAMLFGMVLALCVAVTASAESEEGADIVLKGDAKCTSCHDKDEKSVLAIGKTRHGVTADSRAPTCTNCHGDSDVHSDHKGSNRPLPDRSFTKNSTTPVAARNGACLTCHQGGKRIGWQMSAHANREVACSSCHKIHDGHDKVRDNAEQTEVCYSCHKEQRAQMSRPSHHPVPEGKMGCSSCHNPHGDNPKSLVTASVNETCYSCHTEKRGPFLHNHQPVTEDCTICHNPHGTTSQTLLKQRIPLLCQNCHNVATHRTQLVQQLAGRSVNREDVSSMARGCLNCHTSIHGSNSTTSSSTGGRFRQ